MAVKQLSDLVEATTVNDDDILLMRQGGEDKKYRANALAFALDKYTDYQKLGSGFWVSGATFTAYDQYMVYEGKAYGPLPSTNLPYTVGAIPNTFTYQIKIGGSGENLLRSKTSVPVELTAAQSTLTVVGFNASLSAYYLIAPIGSEVPAYRLFKDIHYTVADITTETITLLQTYPAGYYIAATSLDPTGDGVVPVINVADISIGNGLSVDNITKTITPDVDITGVIDETVKLNNLLSLGYKLKLPVGKIKANINLQDGSSVVGFGAPRYNDSIPSEWDNFGTVIIGTITVSSKIGWVLGNLSIDSFSSGDNGVTGVGARTGYGYIKNVNTRANNHGHLYETATSNSNAGLDPDSGVIGNIIVEDCEHWGGPNGFVTKHHRVEFIRCKTYDVAVQSFVAVSDNINSASVFNRATDSKFEDCVTKGLGLTGNSAEGIRVYTQDRFSADPSNDVNSNGVKPCHNTRIINYKYTMLAGYALRVGDNVNPTVASIKSTNVFIDGMGYSINAFGAMLFQHVAGVTISRSYFGAGSNIGIGANGNGIIVDSTNLYDGGNVQTGFEQGNIIISNNSSIIENRLWIDGLTYTFRNTANTLINQVDFSIRNKPIRLVIDDVYTSINIFSSLVAIKGKGSVIDAMFDGSSWIILNHSTAKTINEQVVSYTGSVNFDFLNANSKNLVMTLAGDPTSIDATVAGVASGETVGLRLYSGGSLRNLSGWSSVWRFEGSTAAVPLGNPPLSIPSFTSLYIEFYVTNGLLIEKFRVQYG